MRNGKWFETVYDDIRERFPRYRIAIFYVYASEKTIRARVREVGVYITSLARCPAVPLSNRHFWVHQWTQVAEVLLCCPPP